MNRNNKNIVTNNKHKGNERKMTGEDGNNCKKNKSTKFLLSDYQEYIDSILGMNS